MQLEKGRSRSPGSRSRPGGGWRRSALSAWPRATLLYGDNAASAITDEAGGSGDFTAELAARILDGEELNTDGITGLLKQTIPDEDEELVWKALDEEEEAFEDIERFDEFVDTWAMRQTYSEGLCDPLSGTGRAPAQTVPAQQMSLL